MGTTLPAGPFKTVETGEGSAPWYIIPYDKHGTCTGPLTRQHLVDSVQKGAFTDLFLFSHGWNNDWEAASERYEEFIAGFIGMRAENELTYSRAVRPVLLGVFWPSTALVMPWERAPRFAGRLNGEATSEVGMWQRELEELAADMDKATRAECYALAQATGLTTEQAQRLAEIVATVVSGFTEADTDAAGRGTHSPSAAQLLEGSKALGGESAAPRRKPGEFGFADEATGEPRAAFSLGALDPRGLVRTATVLQMKDRAGRVGRVGVGPLLHDLLRVAAGVRIHLIGHSYGAIVVLSALCSIQDYSALPKVDSILLLQPAVSRWCFATDVDGEGFPGGYRPALDRVRTPIFTTFSKHDLPLTRLFHLALRRDRDKGQPLMAANSGLPRPPSRFAALGGFGPAGLKENELQVLDMTVPATPYQLRNPAPNVVALRADRTISGHGSVSVPATWWALFQQVDSKAPTPG